MVYVDDNNIISMSRGDSVDLPLFLNAGTDINPVRYVLQDGDKIYFGIMEPNQPFENAIVKKVYTKDDFNENEDVVIKLEPNDTVCLYPGRYYYQVKALFANDEENPIVNTVVQKTQFFIEE